MTPLVPSTTIPPETAPDDPRVGHLLGRALKANEPPRAVIVGFPVDEGVRRNRGRPGAADGPGALRAALYRLTPDTTDGRHAALLERTGDLGDLAPSGDLEGDQQRLADALAPHLRAGAFAIVLGGGHETSFGHYLAYVALGRAPEILNWDAHADVRELADGRGHSGSPFRQALEQRTHPCPRYTVAGIQPHAAAAAHLAYVAQHGRWVPRAALTSTLRRELYTVLGAPAMVSFDLDLVDQSQAPGVSAPSADGVDQRFWLEAAYEAGRTPAVASCDVVELNPRVDLDGRTARLAALTVWQMLRGLAHR